jgi:hypothetical protein
MEVLAITGGIASIAQLIEIAVKTSRAVVDMIDKLQHVPDEVQKYQLTLRSVRSKLQLLEIFLATSPNDIGIPPSFWPEFYISLSELQKDVQAVANNIKPHDTGKRKVASVREKFRFHICDQKAFANAMKRLQTSEENFERLQNTIHL